MKLLIAGIGKLKAGPERDLFAHYADRVRSAGRGIGIGPLDAIELTESRGGSAAQRISEEATRLIARTGDSHRIVLDETGKCLSSRAFAQTLQAARDRGTRRISFLLGGADGHGPQALGAADLLLSLGPMTLPHGLARIVLVEQIYRAVTLIAGHPYHRG